MEGAGTPTLAIIGAGRAGSALAIAAHDAGYGVAAVASRRGEMAARLADTVGARAVATPLAAVISRRPHPPRGARWGDIDRRGVDRRLRRLACAGVVSSTSARGSVPRSSRRSASPAPRSACSTRSRLSPGRTAPHCLKARTSASTPAGCSASGCLALVSALHATAARDRSRGGAAVPCGRGARRQRPARPACGGDATARGRGGERRRSPTLRSRRCSRAPRTTPAAPARPPRSPGPSRGETRTPSPRTSMRSRAYPEARDLYLHLTRAMESLLATRPAAADAGAQVA